MAARSDRVYAVFTTTEPAELLDLQRTDVLRGFKQTARGAQVAARPWARQGYRVLVRQVSAREALALIRTAKDYDPVRELLAGEP